MERYGVLNIQLRHDNYVDFKQLEKVVLWAEEIMEVEKPEASDEEDSEAEDWRRQKEDHASQGVEVLVTKQVRDKQYRDTFRQTIGQTQNRTKKWVKATGRT